MEIEEQRIIEVEEQRIVEMEEQEMEGELFELVEFNKHIVEAKVYVKNVGTLPKILL